MGSNVAAHLNIQLAEYDARIRTFVPFYDEMLDTVAKLVGTLPAKRPDIVDLGIGTGALSARCLSRCPEGTITGIDSDSAMLKDAARRLSGSARVTLVSGSFETIGIPECDAIVASIALHHIPTPERKRALYRRCFTSTRNGGILVNADCFPDREASTASEQREGWLKHLQQSYTRREAEEFLEAWAKEDVYFPLEEEMGWMREAGYSVVVAWRKKGFAVLEARKRG